MPPFHVMSVFYKHGSSDIKTFETEFELREYLLDSYTGDSNITNIDTNTLINIVSGHQHSIDSSWRIVAVVEGSLLFSHTNRGFA